MSAAWLFGKRAALFDAGFTLLAPTRPVHEIYLLEAAALGVEVDRAAFVAAFKQAWPNAIAAYRSKHPDLRSSDALERAAWRDFTADLAKGFPPLHAVHDAWRQRLFDWFDAPHAWAPLPHARELLGELRAAGVKLAVVSNWHSALPGLLEAHGLAERFDAIVTSAGAGRKKPHAEIFRLALAALSVDAADAVHVGDSLEEDVRGAEAAGLAAVWLSAGPDIPGVRRVAGLGELRR